MRPDGVWDGDYFYPRPPRGGRRSGTRQVTPASSISTHALREEGDRHLQAKGSLARHFYPRPPRGGRLFHGCIPRLEALISTHALREEGDFGKAGNLPQKRDFYPRPPRGGRRKPVFRF